MRNVFSSIKFSKKSHSYTLRGKRLKSVTTFVGSLKKPFDRDYWSKYKANQRGVSQQTILDEWNAKSKASLQKGNRVHNYIENALKGKIELETPKDELPEILCFNRFWTKARNTFNVVETELTVGDYELGLGGTVDALLYNKHTKEHLIWDWKTGGKFKITNDYGNKLLPPFSDLDDCEHITYSMQTSLYRLVIERNTDIKINDCFILYLSESDNFRIYNAIDFRDRLLAFLLKG